MILSLMAAAALSVAAAAQDGPAWKAHWVTKAQSNSASNSWIGFRTHVDISDVPDVLEARIAADTKYWVWINGELVIYEGGLKRGQTPFSTYYDKVDIAPYLHKGDNLIGVLLWHLGKNGFSHLDSGTAAMIFEAVAPGIEILSDSSWEASVHHGYMDADTPALNYRLAETSVRFDAREYPYDWFEGKNPEFMGSALELPFLPGEAPFGTMVERPVPMWKNYGLKDYESVERRGDTLVCKLPYNCHVGPYLKVEAPEGKVITMQTDHAVVTNTECVRGQYVTREGVQEYEHLCWMNGEWMYYIVPQDVKILDVKYRETGYDTEFSGSFVCDDELLNSYWKKAARTLYVCMRDTYYDCPDRERAQWWGDEVNELGEAFYLLSPSSHKLALKGIHELIGWQKADGSLYAPVPAGNWVGELPMQTLASVGWYGFYRYWQYSGDDSFIAPIYDRLHRYLHETWQLDGDGLPVYREGGWDWADAGDNCDAKALLNPWYCLAIKAEMEFAKHLGKSADAAADDAIIARMNDAFNARYWDGTAYRSASYTGLTDDRVQAMAVLAGFASEEKYPAITKVLSEEFHATTYMHRYVLDALCVMGHPEIAQERMRKQYPTIMKDDCSTLWEHWDYDGTCNHAWAGAGVITMAEKYAGLEPLDLGFKKFRVCPQMGSLKQISMSVETVAGVIGIELTRKGKSIYMVLDVPEGAEASVPGAKGRIHDFSSGRHSIRL